MFELQTFSTDSKYMGVTPSVAAPGVTHSSGATGGHCRKCFHGEWWKVKSSTLLRQRLHVEALLLLLGRPTLQMFKVKGQGHMVSGQVRSVK